MLKGSSFYQSMTFQKHKLKSLIGGDSHSDDFNKMVKEPEESEIKIDQGSIKTMRSQLIQIHNHILDGLEVFYKFVDTLFSHFPDDVDKDLDGSGDDDFDYPAYPTLTHFDEEGQPQFEDEPEKGSDANREAPIMNKVNHVSRNQNQQKYLKGTFK